jgi:hypothetical protein
MAAENNTKDLDTKEKDVPLGGPLDLGKEAEMKAAQKEGRRLKFNIQKSGSSKAILLLVGAGGLVILGLILVLILSGGESNKNTINTITDSPIEQRDLPEDNNSEGYLQTPPANFGTSTLNLNLTQPTLYRSENVEVNLNEQASMQDGFAVLVSSVERDYRPASEFYYKRIAESGDEIVRVNMLVGNATNANMPIGYGDLAFYSVQPDGTRKEAERISEDVYSPKDGQVLGGKQSRRVSLHYRVKRGTEFFLERTKLYEQNSAKEKEGEEKKPVLKVKINLVNN